MYAATRNKLSKKNFCFACKKTWERGHRCLGQGQVHYIEVISNDESDLKQDLEPLDLGPAHGEPSTPSGKDTVRAMIASLGGVPKYFTPKV